MKPNSYLKRGKYEQTFTLHAVCQRFSYNNIKSTFLFAILCDGF